MTTGREQKSLRKEGRKDKEASLGSCRLVSITCEGGRATKPGQHFQSPEGQEGDEEQLGNV